MDQNFESESALQWNSKLPQLKAAKQTKLEKSNLRPVATSTWRSLQDFVDPYFTSKNSSQSGLRKINLGLKGTEERGSENPIDFKILSELRDICVTEAIPGLTLSETTELICIANALCQTSELSSSRPLDISGSIFLAALTLAFSQNIALLLSDGNGSTSRSNPELDLITPNNTLDKMKGSYGNSEGRILASLRPHQASLSPKSSSHSLSSHILSTLKTNDCKDGNIGNLWGLYPGLDSASLIWALLSNETEVLLDDSVNLFKEYEICLQIISDQRKGKQSEDDESGSNKAVFMNTDDRKNVIENRKEQCITWDCLRSVGAGFWIRDIKRMVSLAENFAKVSFAKSRKPDDAALWYAALGRKSLLQGLYRSTQQYKQAEFLGRDFSQKKNAEAACKNAYVLLGQHRYELSAAFFLLGGCPRDALAVCAKQMKDIQLALFLARLMDGYPGGPLEIEILESYVKLHSNPTKEITMKDSKLLESPWTATMEAWLKGDQKYCIMQILESYPHQTESPDVLAQVGTLLGILVTAECTEKDEMHESACDGPLSKKFVPCFRRFSEALFSAGLPILSLQLEISLAAYDNFAFERFSDVQNSRDRFTDKKPPCSDIDEGLIEKCALALITSPSDIYSRATYFHPSISRSSVEKQVQFLKSAGLKIDVPEVWQKINSINETLQATSMCQLQNIAEYGHFESLSAHSERILGDSDDNSSKLIRQGSINTNKSVCSYTEAHDHHYQVDYNAKSDFHVQNQLRIPEKKSRGSDSGLLLSGVRIFEVDNDPMHAVVASPLLSPDIFGRPIVIATHCHGLLECAAQTHNTIVPDKPLSCYSEKESISIGTKESHLKRTESGFEMIKKSQPAHSGSHDSKFTKSLIGSEGPTLPNNPQSSIWSFPRFLTQIFDQSSWQHDPFEKSDTAHDGDVGIAVADAMASASSGVISQERKIASVSSVKPQNTHTYALASHPTRPLFVSGCQASGRVLLWQFGGPRPVASFTPVTKNDLKGADMESGLLSISTQKLFLSSCSMTSRLSNWGCVRSLAFNPNGERFAGVGEGGVVATWRLGGNIERATDVDGAICSEWWNHCLDKRGRAITFIGGTGAIVAVGGKCSSGNIGLWDSSCYSSNSCIGRLKHHSATVNTLCTLPGGWLLAAGDAAGGLSLSDVRMLGSNDVRVLWKVRASKQSINSVVAMRLQEASEYPRAVALGASKGASAVLVTSGGDNIIRVWRPSSGRLIQSIENNVHHHPKSNPLRRFVGSSGSLSHTNGITGLAVCEDGIISCGSDGLVRLHGVMDGTLLRVQSVI